MTVELCVSVTGGQIARHLVNDEEEVAYFLDELGDLLEGSLESYAENVAAHAPYGNNHRTARMLRALAAAYSKYDENG